MGGASARIVVDLGALADNFHKLSELCRPGQTGAVVKADAYGLGVERVVQRLLERGCEHYFVATLAEGLAVRQQSETARIYVFAGPERDDIDLFVSACLTPVLNHRQQLLAWQKATHQGVCIHIDTGMSRLGFPWKSVFNSDFFAGVTIELLMTHLACADEPEHPLNALQLERFADVCKAFPGVPTSIGNSASIFLGASSRGSLSRPGIALYGGNPSPEGDNPVQPVVKFEAKVLQKKEFDPGETVGYGATYRLESKSTLTPGFIPGWPSAAETRIISKSRGAPRLFPRLEYGNGSVGRRVGCPVGR